MDEIVRLIQTAEKKTPVKVYVRANRPLHFENCHVFTGADMIVMGDYGDIEPVLARNADAIEDMVIECDRRNSALPLLDVKPLHARIEPGAILRAGVSVGDGAVCMLGAILNGGAAVGVRRKAEPHRRGRGARGRCRAAQRKAGDGRRRRAHRRERGGDRRRSRWERRGRRGGRGGHAGRAGKRGGRGNPGADRQDEGRKNQREDGADRRAAGIVKAKNHPSQWRL